MSTETGKEDQVPTLASKLIRMCTSYPCTGTGDADFGLTLPAELSDRIYEEVVKHIEFRRKCMNQGFDNLLELLTLHKQGFDAMPPGSTKST